MRTNLGVLILTFASCSSVLATEADLKKNLLGRWAPVELAKVAPGSKPANAPKPLAAVPKIVVEFTKDGKLLLEGDTSAFAGTFKFVPTVMSDFKTWITPQTQGVTLTYEIKGDKEIEVLGDWTGLVQQLGGGAPVGLNAEQRKMFYPREKIAVLANGKELALINELGKEMKFNRFTSTSSLRELEGKRREAELLQGISPFKDILEKQGVKLKDSPSSTAKPPAVVPKSKPEKPAADKPAATEDQSETLAASRLKLAKRLLDDNSKEDAIEILQQVVKKWPKTKAAEEAKSLLSK
jgi:hypothetical protein